MHHIDGMYIIFPLSIVHGLEFKAAEYLSASAFKGLCNTVS